MAQASKTSQLVGDERIRILEPDGDKPAFRDSVMAEKDGITDRSPVALLKAYAEVRAEEDRIQDEVLGPLGRRRRAIEYLLFEAFSEPEGGSVKLPGVGSVSVGPRVSARIVNRAAAIAWFKENKPDLLTINSQTLTSVVSDMMLDGAPIPEGVEVGTYPSIKSFRKG